MKIEFKPYRLTDIAEIYSIVIDGSAQSELEKFLVLYRVTQDPYLLDDYARIVLALNKIAEQGALERIFRNEGKIKDRVYAIPLEIRSRNKKKHGTLRLYCIRLSETIVIVGGGGEKKTDSYNIDTFLDGIVSTLQAVDKQLNYLEQERGSIDDDINNLVLYID